jgi:hypothetical protein
MRVSELQPARSFRRCYGDVFLNVCYFMETFGQGQPPSDHVSEISNKAKIPPSGIAVMEG